MQFFHKLYRSALVDNAHIIQLKTEKWKAFFPGYVVNVKVKP